MHAVTHTRPRVQVGGSNVTSGSCVITLAIINTVLIPAKISANRCVCVGGGGGRGVLSNTA